MQPICLNGEWDFYPDYAGHSPGEALRQAQWQEKIQVPSSWRWSFDLASSYQPYDLFGYPPKWNEAQSGILRRTFSARWDKDERAVLLFQGVLQRFVVFINGTMVRDSHESFLPVEVDVTEFSRPGETNELAVWCGPYESVETPTGRKVLAPNGSWFAQLARGIWQDVFLEIRPRLAVDDLFIKTSTRRQMIEVEVKLDNYHAGDDPRACCLRLEIKDRDQVVKRFTPLEVNLLSGQATLVCIEQWPEAVFWSPENPQLYTLHATLEHAGSVIDTRRVRFGFREIWLEGHRLILNGTRVNLRGDAWHWQGFVMQRKEYAENWFRLCKDTGINFVRLHAMPYPQFFLEAADELGMLICSESAIYGSSKATQSDDPIFLDRCREHLCSLVLRDRNHPSVIIWSMQNEMRWVDGRDGYKAAMPALTEAMLVLDGTRPVSYDGDNRLVDPELMDIVSMHYNLDGTIASWDKTRPLIFGEHGPWHYIAPQVACDLVGPRAYLDFSAALENIGLSEALFLAYARHEEVTGVTPFNIANYTMWSLPETDVPLSWDDPSTPGPKPRRIPAHTLTVNNGLVPGPIYRLNPSWQPVAAAFKPVTILPDELDTSFYSGQMLARSFSIYNDTGRDIQARLAYRLVTKDGRTIDQGETRFSHPAGMRQTWEHTFQLSETQAITRMTLTLSLYHGAQLEHHAEYQYALFPRLDTPLELGEKIVAYYGSEGTCQALSRLIPGLVHLYSLNDPRLWTADALVLDSCLPIRPGMVQPALRQFAGEGGCVVVLEQQEFSLGDLTLADRPFYAAFTNIPDHPIFEHMSNDDLRFWLPGNPNAPGTNGLVKRAFNRPVEGDFTILLECGGGDFGWGGLLWTPLIEYMVGKGRILLNQLELTSLHARVPQARLLLRNLVRYAIQTGSRHGKASTGKTDVRLVTPDSPLAQSLVKELGISLGLAGEVVIADPHFLDVDTAHALRREAEAGNHILVLPIAPGNEEILSALAGEDARLVEAPVYQLQTAAEKGRAAAVSRGISAFDLDWIDKVTYTPGSYANAIIASHAVEVPESLALLTDVHNPWEAFFVAGKDSEWQKIPQATMALAAPFQPKVYAVLLPARRGAIILCQVSPQLEYPKARRIYTRLLGNLGILLATPLLERIRQEADYGVEAMMALAYAPHQDFAAIEAYFSDPAYFLNNLGEGVYGWMKRIEKRAGAINVPESAGNTYFLTVFVDSAINRDPTRRLNNELPDASIVPDLFVEANCIFRLYLNGRCLVDQTSAPAGVLKLEDAALLKGINRLAMVCYGGLQDIHLNLWFKNKYGDPVEGLRYPLTLD